MLEISNLVAHEFGADALDDDVRNICEHYISQLDDGDVIFDDVARQGVLQVET